MSEVITPVVTSISPTSGPAGTKITIKGSGFVDGNNIWGVFFNDVPTHDWAAPDKSQPDIVGWAIVDDGTIECLAPIGHEEGTALSGTVAVTVRTEGGIDNFGKGPVTSGPVPFEYTA